jgi:photosystem II stability/assembly factor-like uncharacterized protein
MSQEHAFNHSSHHTGISMNRIQIVLLLLLATTVAQAQSWQQVPTGTGWAFQSCWFDQSNPDRGWITGFYVAGFDLIPFVVRTTDGGTTFSSQNLYNAGTVLATRVVHFTSSNVGYIAGGGVVKTIDGGNTWNVVMDVFGAGGQFYDMTFSSSTHGYAVGEAWVGGGMLQTTTDGGTTWNLTPLGGGAQQLTSIARPTASRMYVGATTSFPGDTTFFLSTDNGVTWGGRSFNSNIYALDFISAHTGYFGGDSGIYRTTDDGATWTQVLTTTTAINRIRIKSGSGFAAGADGSIHRTTDDGLTWTPMASPAQGVTYLTDVHIVTSGLAFAVGGGGTLLHYGAPLEVTRSYPFQQGWNLASLPLNVRDPRKTALYPGAISAAYTFDEAVGYITRDTLNPGPGYWLKFPAAESVTMTGIPRTTDTVSVIGGWNLIGSGSAAAPRDSVIQIPPGNVISPYYGYTTGYFTVDTLQPGIGYWVKVGQNGKLILR